MTKFHFRLATLLRLRENTRQERRTALAEAYRAEEILRQRQEQLAADLALLKGSCREAASPGTVDIDRLLAAQRYEVMLRAEELQLGRQRELIVGEIQRRHQALVQANRDVRVLEKLRERQAERHRHQVASGEIRELDDVAGRLALGREIG